MLAQPAHTLTEAFPGDGHPRLVREWEELRGLLLLRCDMVSQLVKSHDLHTATTVAEIEAKLGKRRLSTRAQGFNVLAYLAKTGQTAACWARTTLAPRRWPDRSQHPRQSEDLQFV